jgi:hypothetical protein
MPAIGRHDGIGIDRHRVLDEVGQGDAASEAGSDAGKRRSDGRSRFNPWIAWKLMAIRAVSPVFIKRQLTA